MNHLQYQFGNTSMIIISKIKKYIKKHTVAPRGCGQK